MKTKNKRNLIFILIFFPVFLWISLSFTNESQKYLKPYSVGNKGKEGVSIIYEVLKDTGYTTNLVFKEVHLGKGDTLQIVIEAKGSQLDIYEEDIKKWLEDGGNLLYLTAEWKSLDPSYGREIDKYILLEEEKAIAYSLGKGLLILGEPQIISNKALTQNTDGAYWILTQIENRHINSISFNEYYHYSQARQPSLWKGMPKEIKFIVYEIILFIALIIYYHGKRFGGIIPFHEEVERIENEYIYSAASLYKKGELRKEAIESFYKDFLTNLENTLGVYNLKDNNWIQIWENERLPSLKEGKRLYELMDIDEDAKITSKEMLQIVSIIEHLNKILSKRRETNWKELKGDIHSI